MQILKTRLSEADFKTVETYEEVVAKIKEAIED